jgi:hypothetical protein
MSFAHVYFIHKSNQEVLVMAVLAKWKALAVVFLATCFLGTLATGQASATETDWANLYNWPQSVSSTDSASAVQWGNRQMAAWRGEGSGATRLWWSLDGSAAREVGGTSANAPTVTLWRGHPMVLYRGTDNHVYVTEFLNGDFGASIDLSPGGLVTTTSTPMATSIANGNVLEVVWRGTNDHMYMGALSLGNPNQPPWVWTGQGEVGGGGITTHSPAVAQIPGSLGTDGLPRDGLIIAHTGTSGNVYFTHVYVNVVSSSPQYLAPDYDGRWYPLYADTNVLWHTNSRPTLVTNSHDNRIVRLGILDDDRNMAYIGGTVSAASFTDWGNWEIEHMHAPLVSPPTLYNNTQTGEIDAIAFIDGGLFHLLRVMRCD